jgi:hypothetical protein
MPESVRPSERVVMVPPVGARTPREEREQHARRERKALQGKSDETLAQRPTRRPTKRRTRWMWRSKQCPN